jgi:hypothetical protein
LKLPEENSGNASDVGIGKDFLNRTLVAHEIRARIDEWKCIKLKSSK